MTTPLSALKQAISVLNALPSVETPDGRASHALIAELEAVVRQSIAQPHWEISFPMRDSFADGASPCTVRILDNAVEFRFDGFDANDENEALVTVDCIAGVPRVTAYDDINRQVPTVITLEEADVIGRTGVSCPERSRSHGPRYTGPCEH